ncbi:hypothetical protein [Staphylococcus capitis]|uniref:hypothetical protein n=1 Tax=Staphylococcus capitis TaxID=29388 RepID=UPI001BCE7027|nr:hypothetical protein [Staphylococcus capitis]
MLSIIIHSIKILFRFMDFEKKSDYYFILFINVVIVGSIFSIPVYLDYVLLIKLHNELLSVSISIITYGLLLFFFASAILLIKEMMNFFIAFIDKKNRLFIKKNFNRKYYENTMKLDSEDDIKSQLYENDMSYPLRRLYKGIHYRYYSKNGEKFEEIACMFNKLFYKRLICSKEHVKKKILWLLMTLLTTIVTTIYLLIKYFTDFQFFYVSIIILIIHNIYYFLSVGIFSMVIGTIYKENLKVKLLILRFLKKKI